MEDNIIYDCRFSGEVDDKFINDFISVEREVFKNNYSKELFIKKYINNPFGESVVAVVYLNGKPVAARGLWRNDINSQPAYQPADTCVSGACRGRGIFTQMTECSIKMLNSNDVVYNFPNQNSYPGYIKMGWKLMGEYGFELFTGNNKYKKEHPVKMDKAYADWWINPKDSLYYFKCGDEYYLVRKMAKRFCFKICAAVPREIALQFSKKPFGFCFYRSKRHTFYNKSIGMPLHVVSKSNKDEYIPLWKIDVL